MIIEDPDWQAVTGAYGLGKLIDVERVGRAWSNRVFRVQTSSGRYAVKQLLNPWQDPTWKVWVEEAANFELRAFRAGIRMPRPVLSRSGMILVEVPQTVRVHEWVAGSICPDGPMEPQQAGQVGADLARIHGLDHHPTRTGIFPQANTDNVDRWDNLVQRLASAAPDLAELAAAATPAVRIIGDLHDRSATDFSDQPMSHGDVDQKNLIIGAAGPVLCDWDVAAPWQPRQELARTALSLADWSRPDVARAVVTAYSDAGGEAVDIRPEDFGVDLRIGLDWVVMCAERAAGLIPADEQRQAEATESAPGLLAGLDDQVRRVLEIESWLTG
jgi:Ser/Thr protein kinase RdoA (MazF antagonist)